MKKYFSIAKCPLIFLIIHAYVWWNLTFYTTAFKPPQWRFKLQKSLLKRFSSVLIIRCLQSFRGTQRHNCKLDFIILKVIICNGSHDRPRIHQSKISRKLDTVSFTECKWWSKFTRDARLSTQIPLFPQPSQRAAGITRVSQNMACFLQLFEISC